MQAGASWCRVGDEEKSECIVEAIVQKTAFDDCSLSPRKVFSNGELVSPTTLSKYYRSAHISML